MGSAALAVPQRIISGIPSVTEMLFALDLGDRVVGVTTNCNYPPEALKKEKVGGFFLNLEKVVSLKPDLVVMLEDAQKKEIERFRNYGLPVFTINPRNIDEVMEGMLELGRKTGKEEKAKEIVEEMKKRLAGARPRFFGLELLLRKHPRALVIVGYEPLIVAGGGTFIDDVLKRAGVGNIAGREKVAYPQYSLEKIVQEDPPYIIIPKGLIDESKLRKDRRWRNIEAIRSGKILFIDPDVISRPGPRVVEAVEAIAAFVYH